MEASSIARFTTIDQYITSLPSSSKKIAKEMRKIILQVAPGAEELISYNIPAFKLNGLLVWFAAHSKHIGFYPRVSAIEEFKKELSVYKTAKGSVQFPFDHPLPSALITRMVKFRVNENMHRLQTKRKPLNEGHPANFM